MTTRHCALRRCLPVAALLAVASPAWAVDAQDQAAAEALFNQAKQLAADGKYAQACPKFVESQRLDPTAGTLLSLGRCYERLGGKSASAWGAYKEAEMVARNAGDHDREAGAARLARALEPQLAKLVIVVPPEARVPGLEVKRDGTLVGEGQWGSPLPLDPGEHVIEASAPGKQPWKVSAHVDAAPGTTTVEAPVLIAVAEQPKRTDAAYWTGQRSGGLAILGVGVGGVIGGAALGSVALSKNKASKLDCSPSSPNFCNDAGASLRSDAIHAGNASTVAFVLGGAMIVGGIVLFATAPSTTKQEAARVEILPGVGGLVFRGRF